MVSTDDLEIAEIAKKYGAKVPFLRSSKNSDDFATTFDVLEEVISCYKESLNKRFDNICCIYSCAPFVNVDILNKGFELMKENDFDSVHPILPFSFPIQRAVIEKEGKISMISPEYMNTRSQDLQESYHDTGQFYWCNRARLLENKKILTENTGGIIVSELEAQDIDTEIDWKLAELKFKIRV